MREILIARSGYKHGGFSRKEICIHRTLRSWLETDHPGRQLVRSWLEICVSEPEKSRS